MSKFVASESNDHNKRREKGGKRGAEDEGKEDGEGNFEVPPAENSTISTTASTVYSTTDQFMHTPEFRRHFVEFVHVQSLMALRSMT